jgi:hypothetical protein
LDKLRHEDRANSRGIYTLAGRDVNVSDAIEILTPLGWMRGRFEWTGSPYYWGRLIIEDDVDSGEVPLIFVLPHGSRCRWPEAALA